MKKADFALGELSFVPGLLPVVNSIRRVLGQCSEDGSEELYACVEYRVGFHEFPMAMLESVEAATLPQPCVGRTVARKAASLDTPSNEPVAGYSDLSQDGTRFREHTAEEKRGAITEVLSTWGAGSSSALDDLLPMVYDELRRIARGFFVSERSGHTLDPTAVVHETYFRLLNQHRVEWQDRKHFYAVAALMMRRILTDHARRKHTAKSGLGVPMVPLADVVETTQAEQPSEELLQVDAALKRLSEVDPDKARLAMLRYFLGLTIEEVAEVLGCSRATVVRQWRVTKGWLQREIEAAI